MWPEVDSGQVLGWVTLVQKLDDRFNRCKEKQLALEANLVMQEAQLRDLFSQLHGNIASLYENLGLEQKAQEVRRRAEADQGCNQDGAADSAHAIHSESQFSILQKQLAGDIRPRGPVCATRCGFNKGFVAIVNAAMFTASRGVGRRPPFRA